MSKFPRVSGNQMVRYLQSKGLVIDHREGSHITLKGGNVITVVPAGNKKLKTKTLFSVLLYADISKEQFVDDYKNKLIK